MTLIDLLNYVGLENVRVQALAESLKSAILNKRGETEITFYTREIRVNDLLFESKGKTALIIWMPKDKVLAASNLSTVDTDTAARETQ